MRYEHLRLTSISPDIKADCTSGSNASSAGCATGQTVALGNQPCGAGNLARTLAGGGISCYHNGSVASNSDPTSVGCVNGDIASDSDGGTAFRECNVGGIDTETPCSNGTAVI